jgi:cell division septation protein DedD
MENKRAQDDKPSLGEVSKKSDAPPASTEPPPQTTNGAASPSSIDPKKTYKVEDVTAAAKKGGPFTVTLVGGTKLVSTDNRLYITAVSAKQSGSNVIIGSRHDGENETLTSIEEIEG